MATPTTEQNNEMPNLTPVGANDWAKNPRAGVNWKDHPVRDHTAKTVQITVPIEYDLVSAEGLEEQAELFGYTPEDIAELTAAPDVNDFEKEAHQKGVEAIFKYYNKELEYSVIVEDEPDVEGDEEQVSSFSIIDGVPTLPDGTQIGHIADKKIETITKANFTTLKFIYLVEINDNYNYDYFDSLQGLIPNDYDFFTDPRVRESACIEFIDLDEQIKELKRSLTAFKGQIDLFRKEGGATVPPTDLDMEYEVKRIDVFLNALEKFLSEPGQGNNLVGPDRGLTFKDLKGTKSKLYIGVDYDYNPIFTTLELSEEYEAATRQQTDATGQTVTVEYPAMKLGEDVLIGIEQLRAAGYFVDDVDISNPNETWRVNMMSGIDSLADYQRTIGFLLRMKRINDEFKRAALDDDLWLSFLPKYTVKFPEIDFSSYKSMEQGSFREERGDFEEEQKKTDPAKIRKKREDRAKDKKKEDEKTELDRFNENAAELLDAMSEIQGYYGKLLDFLNIKSLMAKVMQCYTADWDYIDQGSAFCRTFLSLSIEKAFDLVGIIYVEAITSAEDLSEEEKDEALESYGDNFGEPAKAIIAAIRGVVGGFATMDTKAKDAPIPDFGASDYVGPIEGAESEEAFRSNAQPLLGQAKKGEDEAKQIKDNAKKIDKFIDDIDKYLNFSDFCDKIAGQIPSISSLLSVSNVGGRPGDIASLKQFKDFPDDFVNRFTPPDPPTIEFSSDFSFQDYLAFVGNATQVMLEEVAKATLQGIVQGLMKDWLEACQRDKLDTAEEDRDAQQEAQEAMEGLQSPDGLIVAGLASAVGSPLDELITLDLLFSLINGLRKDELCFLFSKADSNISASAFQPALDLIMFRLRNNFPELYFAGLDAPKVLAMFRAIGEAVGPENLEFCSADTTFPDDVRICLNPAVEAAQKEQMSEEGVPEEIAQEILDMRRAQNIEQLTNLLRNMLRDTLLPETIPVPQISVDQPYINKIIVEHLESVYTTTYDNLVGELQTFKALNLELRDEDKLSEAPESLPEGFAGNYNYYTSEEMTDQANELIGRDKNVNTKILDLITENKFSDGLPEDTNFWETDFEEVADAIDFFKLEANNRVTMDDGIEDGTVEVFSQQANELLFESPIESDIDLETLLNSTKFLTDITVDFDVDGLNSKNVANNLMQANFVNLMNEGINLWVTENGGTISDYQLSAGSQALQPTVDKVGNTLIVQGRRVLNSLFRGQMQSSKLFKTENFQKLRFVSGDPCEPLFSKVELLPFDKIKQMVLADYQTLINANLTNFNVANAVMLTSLVYTLIDIYIYEFLLSFVYFGKKIDNSFYSSYASVTSITKLVMDDVKEVLQDNAKIEDLFNVVLNIPFIQSKQFDATYRARNWDNSTYDMMLEGKEEQVVYIINEIIRRQVDDGGMFTEFQKMFTEVNNVSSDLISQFQNSDEVDDLQSIIAAFTKARSYSSYEWYGDMTATKTHAAVAVDSILTEQKKKFGAGDGDFLPIAGALYDEGSFRSVYTQNRDLLDEIYSTESQFILEPYLSIPDEEQNYVTYSLLDLEYMLPTHIESTPEAKVATQESVEFLAEALPLFEKYKSIVKDFANESEAKTWKLGVRLSLVDRQVGGAMEGYTAESAYAAAILPQAMKHVVERRKTLTLTWRRGYLRQMKCLRVRHLPLFRC